MSSARRAQEPEGRLAQPGGRNEMQPDQKEGRFRSEGPIQRLFATNLAHQPQDWLWMFPRILIVISFFCSRSKIACSAIWKWLAVWNLKFYNKINHWHQILLDYQNSTNFFKIVSNSAKLAANRGNSAKVPKTTKSAKISKIRPKWGILGLIEHNLAWFSLI